VTIFGGEGPPVPGAGETRKIFGRPRLTVTEVLDANRQASWVARVRASREDRQRRTLRPRARSGSGSQLGEDPGYPRPSVPRCVRKWPRSSRGPHHQVRRRLRSTTRGRRAGGFRQIARTRCRPAASRGEERIPPGAGAEGITNNASPVRQAKLNRAPPSPTSTPLAGRRGRSW